MTVVLSQERQEKLAWERDVLLRPPHLPATEPTRVTALLRATTESTVLGQTDSSGARQLCIPVSNRAGKREGSGQAPGEVGMLSYLMPLAVRIPHVS